MACVAVLTAAGSGSRLGHLLPKALVPLAGEPLVLRAARSLAASGVVDRIVVTAPSSHLEEVARLFAAVSLLSPAGSAAAASATGASATGADDPRGSPANVLDPAPESHLVQHAEDTLRSPGTPGTPGTPGEDGVQVTVVAGGATRQASVAAALATLAPPAGRNVVLVHDAARALTPPGLVRRVVTAVVAGADAVVPALPVTDTVKQVKATADGGWLVVGTPDRSTLRAVQTPQGFAHGLLERAHAAAADRSDDEARAVSDDAGLVELLGEPVRIVEGDERALKITTPADLETAERWLSRP